MSIEELQAENARLKAEVDRLEHQVKYYQIEADTDHARWLRALEEVERLRKAGNAMAEAMWYGDAERSIWVKKFAESGWNAAKEGKPSV